MGATFQFANNLRVKSSHETFTFRLDAFCKPLVT